MDGEIIHYLDGLPVEEPLGWLDFSEELDRDIRERIISVKYATELTFTGGAYAYLNSINDTDGYCRIVLYEAKQRCNGTLNTCAKGVLILADAEWNLTRCEVVVPVVDDSIGARVISNKDIPISPAAEASKNGITIAPVPVLNLLIHDPQGDGTTELPDTRRTWDWFDAITHAVKYMTDDTVGVVSDWYANLDDAEKWALVDGLELRTHDGANTRVVWNFKQLFDEMAGRYNLWLLATRDANGNPLLRIEPEAYFYSGPGPVMELDIQDLKRTVDSDRLYARVVVGCDDYIRQFTDTPLALPYIPLLTQGKEEYHFTGVCNTSETLELSFDFITDSNAIEDVVLNANEEYDEDIFLLQYYEGPLASTATSRWQFTPDGILFVWPFNQQGLNANILNRYYLPSSVGANFGPQTPYSETTPAALTDTLNGLNQASTPAVLFGTPYTAAVSEYAYFEVNVPWRIVSNTPQLFGGLLLYAAGNFQIIAERFDASNVLIQSLTFDANATAIAPGLLNFSAAFGFSLNIGDYVQVSYVFTTSSAPAGSGPIGVTPGTLTTVFEIPDGATIEKTLSNGGGFADGAGPAPMLKYIFERHINLNSWLSLTGNPEQSMTISPSSSPLIFGWISNAKRNVATGSTQWEVIARP
jgi:hypothetical protein